jgi:hypothetical protein
MKILSNPEKDYIYRMFVEYFGNIWMTKIKDDNDMSVYMARFPCLLLNEQHCLVLLTRRDNYPPYHRVLLDSLRWISLQTRSFSSDSYLDLMPQSYEMKRHGIFEKRITNVSRSKDISIYHAEDLPLMVSLLHMRGNEFEYPNDGTLNSAIETFRTVIQFRTDH